MSKQSKNRRKKVLAQQFSKTRKSGGSGPATTAKKNTKVHTWWRKPKEKAETSRPSARTGK